MAARAAKAFKSFVKGRNKGAAKLSGASPTSDTTTTNQVKSSKANKANKANKDASKHEQQRLQRVRGGKQRGARRGGQHAAAASDGDLPYWMLGAAADRAPKVS